MLPELLLEARIRSFHRVTSIRFLTCGHMTFLGGRLITQWLHRALFSSADVFESVKRYVLLSRTITSPLYILLDVCTDIKKIYTSI